MPDYRRHLPHWQPAEVPILVTWRLFGSWTGEDLELVLRDKPVAGPTGPCWLTDSRIAALVADTIIAGDSERNRYELHAWAIMPTHVHILLTPRVSLAQTTRWIKGSTSRRANLLFNRTGQRFWKEESFDPWMRNTCEFNEPRRYVEFNPVSCGFVASPVDWRWSSARGQAEPPVPPFG